MSNCIRKPLYVLENKSKCIPEKIQFLYDNGWNINPSNHKWFKNDTELSLNEACVIENYRKQFK